MFADYLNETPWDNRSHRGWTTLASFAAEAVAGGILLMIPILYTSGLPPLQSVGALILPVPAPAPLQPARPHASTPPPSNVSSGGRVIAPPSIPREIAQITESFAPDPIDPGGLRVIAGTGTQADGPGAWGSLGTVAVAPPPVPTQTHPVRVSYIMEGNLIRRVQPEYPAIARMARVQGSVVLSAIISRNGTIENLQLISGPAVLVNAAVDAVKQWRYRPYILNDQPVEVETRITVNFSLTGG